jgi:hypothetical protein
MTAKERLNKFVMNPSVEFLLTAAEFETLSPIEKGFCSYVQADWDESGLKHLKDNPYPIGSPGYDLFNLGSHEGMIWAQDSEE